MTRRFLSKDYEPSDINDVALRQSLDDFIDGAELHALPHLKKWIGALRLLRLVERETEGMHRSVNKVLSRAPNVSEAYISTERRSDLIMNTVLRSPKAGHYLK